MIKWADYLITNIKYFDIDGKRYVDEVEVHTKIDCLGKNGSWYSRIKVISLIRIGNAFCTVRKQENRWTPGAYIIIDEIKGEGYLKILANDLEEDDLEDMNFHG
jgi:hypothetical protein